MSAKPETDAAEALRILIVDDQPDAADSLAVLLGLLGHRVSVAYGGEDALGLARHLLPDAVILDLNMPSLNGFDVARCLRSEPLLESVGLVALSGGLDPDARQRCLAVGIDVPVSKPTDIDALQDALRRAVEAHQHP